MSSERVLIWLKPNYLGDAVMATPLLDAIIQSVERPFLLAGQPVFQVLQDRLDRVQPIEALNLGNPLALIKQARALIELRIDTAILVNRSFRSALCARIAGIPNRIGHDTEGRGFLLTSRLRYDQARYEAECYLDLARAAGFGFESAKPSLQATSEEKGVGKRLLDGAMIGVQPGARYASKRIPLTVMSQVVDGLRSRGLKIALLGGEEEAPQGADLIRSAGEDEIKNFIGSADLREAMGILSNLRLMIGSDTGLMHIAAALGTPTISAYGPNPFSKWAHDYRPHRPIRAPDGKMRLVDAQSILGPALEILAAGRL